MEKISNIVLKKLESLYKLDKLNELEKETKKLLEIEDNNTILLNILGVVYLKKKFLSKAEKIFKKILDQNFKDTNALKNLGEVYRKLNKFSYAIKYYEIYLKIIPNDNEVINNIASCYLKNKKYRIAINYYRNLLKIDPQNQEYLINLAFALINSLDIKGGIEILEKVLDKNPINLRAYTGYLSYQYFNQDLNFSKVNNYIKKFNQSYKKKILTIIDYKFEKNPKKINVGFISPDFRAHPVAYSITGLIKYLKFYNFKLFAYYNFNIEDNLTLALKKDFDFFHNIVELNNEQIINKIRSDGIHILIDLAGHSMNNNLEIFYYNPAPVQMSWLGSMTTTGIKEINYKIVDENVFTESMEKNYSEKLLKLPNIWTDFVVYQGENMPSSFSKNESDQIIFGSFAGLKKINDSVIKLWAKVLKKFVNTKIYFKAPELNDDDIQKNLIKKFFNYGISSDRLILDKSSDHKTFLQSFSKVDISLDSFPWNGLTTSFESIWMGVPIFCLKGDNLVYSRCSYSINKNLNMYDWIANDENDYLIKLEKILSDKKKLMLIKKNLRENAIKNNLFNSKEFTKNFANILTKAWKDFVAK